jgi:NADH kinase
MDGREAGELLPGESVEVAASPHPIPCINRSTDPSRTAHVTGGDNWVRDINTLLGFNMSFKANRSTLGSS